MVMDHSEYLQLAIEEAVASVAAGGGPFGALIIRDGNLLSRGNNRVTLENDPTAHAEMIALTQAAHTLGSWRLEGCLLYVTLEPCPMCAGAVVQARVPYVVYGCTDPKAGACDTLFRIASDPRLNHRAQVIGGVLAERCAAVLTDFFAAKRRLGKK